MIRTYNQCIFIDRKIRHNKFLANISSQCTCQYDVIMKMYYAPQLHREADRAVFDDKNCILWINSGLWKNIKWIICLITGLLIKFCTYTISKILLKVKIAHTRSWRYIDVVYKSQKCKGIHLIDRDRLLNINYTSIHISKKCCDPHEFWEMNFLLAVEMLLTV